MDTEQRIDPRRRELKPEYITVGGETFIRNDILARQQGESERSLNRGDARGAPYRFFGGVKYRPQRLHAEWVMSTVQVRQPQPSKRTQKRTRKRTADSRALAGRRPSAPARRRRERPRAAAATPQGTAAE